MARDDMLRRYQEAGSEFIEATRARAEELFGEIARITEGTQRSAQERVDDLREGSRRGTDQLLETIRRELTNQFAQFSVATKADLSRIERRLGDLESRIGGSPAGAAAPAAKGGGGTKKAAGTKKAGGAAKTTKATKATKAAKAPQADTRGGPNRGPSGA